MKINDWKVNENGSIIGGRCKDCPMRYGDHLYNVIRMIDHDMPDSAAFTLVDILADLGLPYPPRFNKKSPP